MKKVLILLIVSLFGFAAWAQDVVPKVEVPIVFSLFNVHPNLSPVTSFNLYGGGGQFNVNFGRVFGVKADLMGYTQGSGLRNQLQTLGFAGQVNGNAFTYMFGPQIKKHSGRVQPFGEVLFGATHTNAYATILTAEGRLANASSNNNFFTMAAGGGIDLKVSRHFSVRPVEVDYVLTRFHVNGTTLTSNQNNFRYNGGLIFTFGGAPPIPPTASCSVSPTEIMAGEPVTAKVTTQNFNPKHTVNVEWTSTGGKISRTGETASVDTAGMAPGNYTVTATATDAKQKKNNVATCNASFVVKPPPPKPPTLSCSANPATVRVGEPSTITCQGASPDNRPLTYTCQSTVGRVTGAGPSETLDTTGAAAGEITVNCTVSDDRNLTASSSATVTVEVPPPPPQASKASECDFTNAKKPWRVDNLCKAKLDDIAQALRNDPNAKAVIVGFATADETSKKANANLAAQRAFNSKAYLTGGEAHHEIDPGRIEVRTGTGDFQKTENWVVPPGATFSEEGTTAVDESRMK